VWTLLQERPLTANSKCYAQHEPSITCLRVKHSAVHTWPWGWCHITDAQGGEHALCGALYVSLQLIQLPAER